MAENPKPEPNDKEQSKRFEETSRLLEVDESGRKFEDALKIINRKEKPRKSK